LFEAFPTIQKVAPEIAADLLQDKPELSKADENFKLRSGGYNLKGMGPAEAQSMHDRTLQRAIVKEIAGMQETDLDHARQLAKRLTDVDTSIQGNAALLWLIADRDEARHIYDDQWTRLQQITNKDDQLRSMVALSKASFRIHDSSSFAELAATALEQGATLFEQDSRVRPEWSPYARRGYSDVVELVTFGTNNGLKSLPADIQKLASVELKAYLVSVEGGSLLAKQNR
jgi:hypothetical protein